MAVPASKDALKEYCLRNLGKPVIDVNVDDEQIDDRLDEGLQYFAQYHYDGIERVYLKHQFTQTEIDRAQTDETLSTVTDTADSTVTAAYKEQKNYIPMPDAVMSVTRILPFTDKAALNLFDVRYQLRLNDLYDFSSTSVKAGDFIIIECYRKLDPATFTDIFNDIYLKKYCTQLIKRQWGANLIKFGGVQMLGGVTLNGEQIYQQAIDEIQRLEEEMKNAYELPPNYMMG
jgi:hypothetical protein